LQGPDFFKTLLPIAK